jgi:hypothetical protein
MAGATNNKGNNMTPTEFDELNIGDIVQHVSTGERNVIIQKNYVEGKAQYIAVRAKTITNPPEWRKINK